MNAQNEIKLETVEDLVSYAVNNYYLSKERWKLDWNSYTTWVDEKAGRAWWDENNANEYPHNAHPDSKEYKAYLKRKKEVEKLRPAEEKIYEYYLYHGGGFFRGKFIYLSKELYDLIDSIWTKSPSYRGSDNMVNKGRLTIIGMLKRLGNTDVSEKIKAAEQAEKDAVEKRRRNYDRKQIRETATKLFELLTKLDSIDWDTSENGLDIQFLARLSKLTRLIDEV